LAAAARAFREAGEHVRAEACSIEAGDLDAAAADRRASALLLEAARGFEASLEFAEAAVTYLKLSRPLDAARCFEAAGAPGQAAALYRDCGSEFDALRCSAAEAEASGEWAAAAELYDLAALASWWEEDRHEQQRRAGVCRAMPAEDRGPA
jgi:hypothetical protein